MALASLTSSLSPRCPFLILFARSPSSQNSQMLQQLLVVRKYQMHETTLGCFNLLTMLSSYQNNCSIPISCIFRNSTIFTATCRSSIRSTPEKTLEKVPSPILLAMLMPQFWMRFSYFLGWWLGTRLRVSSAHWRLKSWMVLLVLEVCDGFLIYQRSIKNNWKLYTGSINLQIINFPSNPRPTFSLLAFTSQLIKNPILLLNFLNYIITHSCRQQVQIIINTMDMSKTPKPKPRFPWSSQSSAYQENTIAIRMANESFGKDKQISIENSFSDRDSRIIKKSMKLAEVARNAEPHSDRKYRNTKELILNEIRLEDEKYAVFDSTSEHSSDQEVKVNVQSEDIENIVDSVTKDPVNGKLTFVAKLIRNQDTKEFFRVVRLKGIGKIIPQVHQIRSIGNFALYEIQTNSQLKKIAFELVVGQTVIATSRGISFAPRQILLDLELSYNFKNYAPMRINMLEGVLASCVLEGDRLADEIIQLNGKREFRSKILAQNERFTVDEETIKLIRENKNTESLLKLLKLMIEEQGWEFGHPSKLITNSAYLTLAQIFIGEMLKFKPSIGREQRQELTIGESLRLMQLFIHFICLIQLQAKGLSLKGIEQQVIAQMGEFILFSFQVSQLKLYHNLVQLCLNRKVALIPQGYDTIKEQINNHSPSSPQFILTHLENICFNIQVKKVTINPMNLFIDIFQDKKFENNDIYADHLPMIEKLTMVVFEKMDVASAPFSVFIRLYKTYWNFRENHQLVVIVRNAALRSKIQAYVKGIKDRLEREDEKQKVVGISLIQLYFITCKDDELVQDEEQFKALVRYLIDRIKDANTLDLVVKLYFEIFKRGRLFSPDFIKSITTNFANSLTRFPSERSLMMLNKYFSQDYLQNQELITICNDNLLKPIISKLFPEGSIQNWLNKARENHSIWHNQFKYQNYISQQVLEKMMKVVQKRYGNDNLNKGAYLSLIKADINRYIDKDEEKRSSLLAIIESDMIIMDVENVWSYFTQKRHFLKILIKIMKKDDSSSQDLRSTLQEIREELKNKRVDYYKIQRLKAMKPNEWHHFLELTSDFEIPILVNEIYEIGSFYLNNLKKLQDFVRYVGVTFKSPNHEQIILKLQKLSKNYIENSISQSSIEHSLPIFSGFDYGVLSCYKLKPFFASEKLENSPIEKIIKTSNTLLKNLQTKVEEIYTNFDNNVLNSNNFYYFHPRKEDVKEFRNILIMTKKDSIPTSLEDIVNIYTLIAENDENLRLLTAFTMIQKDKFGVQVSTLTTYTKLCTAIKDKKSIPVKDLEAKLNQVHNTLQDFKLNLKENKEIFEVFAYLIENQSKFAFYRSIEEALKDLKDDVNEMGGEITYEEIEDCETTIQFLNEVYEPAEKVDFPQFIKAVTAFIDKKKKANKDFVLSRSLKSSFSIESQLREQKANLQDNDRGTTKFIDDVIKRVHFQFKVDQNNKDKVVVTITVFPNDGKSQTKIVGERELFSSKERAIMLCCTLDQKKKLVRKRQLDSFLEIVKIYERLKEQEIRLTEWGFSQFDEKSVIVDIRKSQLGGAQQLLAQRQIELDEWRKEIKKLYEINFKAAHLQGKKYKEFYDFISKPNQKDIPTGFLIINEDTTVHNKIVSDLNKYSNLSKHKGLSLICSYFKLLKESVVEEQVPDREQNFLHFKIMAQGEIDFIKGIQEIGSQRVQKIKYEQILTCTTETSKSEIKSFVQRALRDLDSQYIILSFQNLDRRKQQFIVDEIKSFKAEHPEGLRLKLCLVGNSELELLFKFASEELNKSPDKAESLETISKSYQKKMRKECQKVKIVYSSHAGIGKTTFIKNDSQARYQCSQQYFLPLSGIMAVPVESNDYDNNTVMTNETEKFIWDRFDEASRYFRECEKKNIKSCLVIQLYNIQPSVVEMVNKFLSSVIFFKSYKYRSNNGKISDSIPIYVELENISLPTYARVPENLGNFPPQMKSLPFLREIRSVCGENIIKVITQFKASDIAINNADKGLNYILYHLKLFDNGDINKIAVKTFDEYALNAIAEDEGRTLITKYFFSQFKKGDQPSGYLWIYFRSLLLEASRNFSTSYFLTISSLAEMDVNIRQANPALHVQMKLQATFRSQFYKVILNNCIEFIKRSVKPGHQNAGNQFNQTMENLPFLIIPNIDGDSFSFIYNKSKNVPQAIKSMIVLQTPRLIQRIFNTPIETLFQEENLANFQQANGNDWVERASQILSNISGNRHYKINCEKGYIVNIDNFFKMCLIVQRMRLNIPIVIMGEAGIGKTALLRHTVRYLFEHQFAVFNINTGLPLESKKNFVGGKTNESLASIVEKIKEAYDKIERENAENKDNRRAKKLWVFFDEFNTLRELGFFKEIIIDGRYLGKEQPHVKNVVMMAACNPHRKLELNQNQQQQQYVREQTERLAFDVLPAPHSLMECMWNYGALTKYQYIKYISKMLTEIEYKNQSVAEIILAIHEQIQFFTFKSSVSLRDIDRFRQLYRWFEKNLPRRLNVQIKDFGPYNNIEERAFLLACYFTYILRFDSFMRQKLSDLIEKAFGFKKGYLLFAKETQESDLCSRLNFNWDAPIAVNSSLKENIYSCFVCINTRLPLLIIGAPGSSKSLSLRILAKNLKEKQKDEYLTKFKRIRQYPIQGSQNTTTNDIKTIFEKAHEDLKPSEKRKREQSKITQNKGPITSQEMKELFVIVFDEIGLAEKSKDNPLKVLHPYLEVSRQENLQERMLSFIGISNSQLDVSKMSRLLVLRRPPSTLQDLKYTALNIAVGFRFGDQIKIKYIIERLTQTYSTFLTKWKARHNNYPLFFGLRDFYGLIKIYMAKLAEREIDVEDDQSIIQCAEESIFQNFHGWQGIYKDFKEIFFEHVNIHVPVPEPTMKETLQSVVKTLDKESFRYPLIIAEDYESLCFVKWFIQKRYPHKSAYMEGSPFTEDKDYSLKLLGEICRYMESQNVLILSNLSEGVKTGLYDFFNKSFTVRASNNNKYLKMRTQEDSLSQKNYLYNEKFNCVYLLLEKDLQFVEPPFLSRFQKYRFSLSSYRKELSIGIMEKVKRFLQKVEEICKNNKMQHFKISNLFINVNEAALESLVVSAYQTGGAEQAYKEALRRLIMNSGQYFFKIYKHFIEPNGDLPQIRDLMNEAIESKNNGSGDRSLIIRFTNDKHYTNKFTDKSIVSAEFVTFKKEADFEEEISKFFKSVTKKTLYISLNVFDQSTYLNYVTSQIEKAYKRALAERQEIQQKKIRLLYIFDKEREDQKNSNNKGDRDIAITHFTKYKQEFDDGRLDEIKNVSKKELFNNVIKIDSLFAYVHKAFDFTFDCGENALKAQAIFSRLTQNLYTNKNGLLGKQAQDVTLFLEKNLEMNEQVIKQMLLDGQVIKMFKNYREALTKYFADRKLLGALAVFLRYLFEKESFMSYSSQQLLQYYDEILGCKFGFELQALFIDAKNRSNNNYQQFVNELIESKKQYIANDYRNLKITKKLPTIEKKLVVKIVRPRLLPFSKGECDIILNCNEKKIGWHIKQIYQFDQIEEKEKFENASKSFQQEFKKATMLMVNQKNLYHVYINEDKQLKTMLFLDLLSDFCDEKGLTLRYLSRYYQIISQFFAVQAKDKKSNNKKEKTINFTKMISILLGYEDIWIQLFKVCQTICDEGIDFGSQPIFQEKAASKRSIRHFVEALYKYLEGLILGANILTTFKNAERYTTLFVNLIFHLEKLEQIIDSPIPEKFKSTRTTLVFIQMFEPNNKSKHLQSFMKFRSQINVNNSSHYQQMYHYFQGLKQASNPQQIEKITQFQANQLFYEWFKQQPNNAMCLEQFISKCNDQVFVHNSVATINLFLENSYNSYNNVEECFRNLGERDQVSSHLDALGKNAKTNKYRNNLAILITNIFIQKLILAFNGQAIINDERSFKYFLDKIISAEVPGIPTLFAFAYFKIYLKEYINKLVKKEIAIVMAKIDEILSADNIITKNLRFYCLKLLRTLKPIKEIKEEYIKVKKVKWIDSLADLFQEEPSRSISVPNENKLTVSERMAQAINKIIQNHGGSVELFDHLIQEANGPYNRYVLLNFFMRYYFSMSYNEKLHRTAVLAKLEASRVAYTQKIGKYEFQLLLRYASSKFDQNLKVEKASDFKQDLFLYFNSLNWLLASKATVSPFHSYFFRSQQFHTDFKAAFEGLFFPCGPQNDFIRIAQGVYVLTRNNNIGVYLCSGQCDYIYFHENCGWPSQQSTCPICGKAIGCKPGQSHTVNRIQEGAKRIISPLLVDKVGKFYVYSMTALTNYWEMQRNYIQAEINRMKNVSVVKAGQSKLTGFQIEINDRVSTLTYNIFKQNINSILYCLLGLGVINQEQSAAIFKGKNIEAARTHLFNQTNVNIDYIKKALGLENKVFGWMFGIQKHFYNTLINFNQQFSRHIGSIKEYSEILARKLEQDINQKKVAADYFELYKDMASTLRKGLLTKELDNVFDMSAANRFTRDFLETKLESYIKTFTTMEKFALAEQNSSLQGKMQFPMDVLLTEDELNEGLFQLSRIFKIPDREIKYNEIIINYELNIRENYPFLDYLLKNSDSIIRMLDFYNILTFSNELAKEVENNYERKDASRSIISFIKELWDKKQERLHEILRNPRIALDSWNRLAKVMGTLQTQCTPIGKMGEYDEDTPIQAFLVETITKENLFGLTVTSLFHNFAKLHNELVSIMNARKNQIPQYKCLNLYNESKKINPQKLQQSDVFMITEKELIEKLYQNSISSINYGKNFIFNNFDAYQHYFLMKLLGKCEIISDFKKFKNICYNGQAFAQTSQSSNTLTQVREYFYEELTRDEIHELKGVILNQGDKGKIEEYVVKLRGDLEKIMIAIRNLNGVVEAKNLGDFVNILKLDEVTYQLKSETFGNLQVSKIVHFYQILELQLKPAVIDKLPERYKQIMDKQTQQQIRNLINELPLEDQYRVTLSQFGYALYRFITRILQGGVQQNDKVLFDFLPYRQDFWPKGFEEYKLQQLSGNEKLKTLTFAYTGHLFEIVERMVKNKMGGSRI